MDPYDRLKELGLSLPPVANPVGSYVPAVLHERTLYVAGQTPFTSGEPRYRGVIGEDLSIAEGYEAARHCILNALAAAESVIGDLRRVERVLRVTGYVVAPREFTAHSQVVNGASDLLVQVFGEAGKHARSSLGVYALPGGPAVEIDLLLSVRP